MGKPHIRVKATHHYVEDPDMARTLNTWVMLLAKAIRNRAEEPPTTAQGREQRSNLDLGGLEG